VDEVLAFSGAVTVKSDNGTSFSGPLGSWRSPEFESEWYSVKSGESIGTASCQKECLYVKAIYVRGSAMGVVSLIVFGQDGSTILTLLEYPK